MTAHRFDAPEAIKRVSDLTRSSLRTTIHILSDRGIDIPENLASELADTERHLDAVRTFSERMTFGSATPNHAEAVLDFLICEGWTPPPGVYVLAAPKAADDE